MGGLDPSERASSVMIGSRSIKVELKRHCSALFEYSRNVRLIVNIDINLYSSAAFALKTLGHFLRPKDIILMDELYDVEGEFVRLQRYVRDLGGRDRLRCLCHDGKVFTFELLAATASHKTPLA